MKPFPYDALRFWFASAVMLLSCWVQITATDPDRRLVAAIWWATGTILFFMPDRKP